jgi:fatty acid amide hydrolase 2
MTGILDQSAIALARDIRTRTRSSVEVVEAHIAKIQAVNPALNAMIADRFDAARREAATADALVAKGGDVPPLTGVPFTVKEYFDVEGMPASGGLWSRRERIAPSDATVVRRLRAAGAIVLGVSNVPEGGLWLETYNAIYGRTNNPWDRRRTSGGSSGGEGALVGSGASPFGIGSDIGGSIRIPAAFCGCVGHKPTGGLVPNTGQFPGQLGPTSKFLGTGPLTRRVEDLWPILRIIAGPDGEDEAAVRTLTGNPADVDLDGLVVIPMPSNGRVRVRPEMQDAVRDAARALQDRGAVVHERAFPRMARAFEIWTSLLSSLSTEHYGKILGDGAELRPWRELAFNWTTGRSGHTLAGLVLAGLDELSSKFPGQMARYVDEGRALQAELEDALGDRGVLLHPPYSRPAPWHRAVWRTPFDFACTAIFNVLEFPVTQVPVRLSAWNVPIGVQVAGSRGADAVTIAAAAVIEAEFGGWRSPP